MGTVAGIALALEAEIAASGMTVQVGRFDWDRPVEVDEYIAVPALTMLLSPAHACSEGYLSAERGRGTFGGVGDMIFSPAGLHLHVRSSGGPLRLVRCCFERSWFEATAGLGDPWAPRSLRACLDIKNPRLRTLLARLVREALEPGFASALLVEGLGTCVAVEIGRHFRGLEQGGRAAGQKLAPWQMNRITHYVESLSNYLPDVEEIADLCGISARHLRRLFKETTNQTLYQYTRDAWAAKAKGMLSDTRLSIKEIASRLGFSDASSFSIAFRRATGESPKLFRQQVGRLHYN